MALCHRSKKAYFHKYFSDKTDNPKQTWQGIRSIINIKSTSKFVPKSLIVDNEISTDPKSMVNSFNNYFSSVASKLQVKV